MFKRLLVVLFVMSQIIFAQSKIIVTAEGDTIRLHPIGDSITRGTKGYTYRQFLKELLKTLNINVNFVGQCPHAADAGSSWTNYQSLYKILEGDIEHDGWGGVKIDQLTDMRNNTRGYPKITIEQMVKDNPSDIILLMIGTNDIISNYQLSTAPVRLDTIISRILRSTKNKLVVTSIPPTPLPIANGTIKTFNAAIPAIVASHKAKGAKISFIDINSMMGNDDISDDSYHPNSKGYEKIGKGFFEAIKSIITSVDEKKNYEVPGEYELKQNYPNPFNPETVISWQIAVGSYVTLKVYDVLGKEVATLVNGFQQPGIYSFLFNVLLASTDEKQSVNPSFTSGIYFYRLTAGKFSSVKKMLLVK